MPCYNGQAWESNICTVAQRAEKIRARQFDQKEYFISLQITYDYAISEIRGRRKSRDTCG